MSKLLTVFGATGKQGGSVVNYVLNDPTLSQLYKIRIITRDAKSAKAKQFQEGVEVVEGDMMDREFLEIALSGTNTVFIMTAPVWRPDGIGDEDGIAKTIAKVALDKGAEYIIFSTLPSIKDISGGIYSNVGLFDRKAEAERYIRNLPIKASFISAGFFMENFLSSHFFLSPRQAADGTWVMSSFMSPKTQLPFISSVQDTGKFAGTILAEPERYAGKTLGAGKLYAMEEIADIIARITGKNVLYQQIGVEDFRQTVPYGADTWVEGLRFMEELGYFGPDTKELLTASAKYVSGRLTTLEEFFHTHSFHS
ncbi:hypothetical protein B0I35DRAFT_455312 [Stachybotrys elegans]|uniref:NmrA-like domain-containing protein n=1 Tax=Stachybotrys elegans TaxID=80388 RepID=A0A8K0S847_9HYPO|nr:hypothetical protein B0I35DRAFT_455312 [Stachybotrys elegans]